MGVNLHPGELHPQGYRAVTVVPPPERAGRYRVEFGGARRLSALPSFPPCGCEAPDSVALVWLTFLEEGREQACELTGAVCSRCQPEHYQRVRQWARQQQAEPGVDVRSEKHGSENAAA